MIALRQLVSFCKSLLNKRATEIQPIYILAANVIIPQLALANRDTSGNHSVFIRDWSAAFPKHIRNVRWDFAIIRKQRVEIDPYLLDFKRDSHAFEHQPRYSLEVREPFFLKVTSATIFFADFNISICNPS